MKFLVGVSIIAFVSANTGYLSADFTRSRDLTKRSDSISTKLISKSKSYLVQLEVGGQLAQVELIVDTGSSDMFVIASGADYSSSYPYNSYEVDLETVKSQKRNVFEDKFQRRAISASEANSEASTKIGASPTTSDSGYLSSYGYSTGYESAYGSMASESYGAGYGDDSSDDDWGVSEDSCLVHGTFNPGSSHTFSYNTSADYFYVEYADETAAYGTWGRDDVQIGGITVKQVNFAVANQSTSETGVLGLGLPRLETTNGDEPPYQYENFPMALKNQGLIKKNLYSLHLNQSDSDSGTLLFGAIDHAKYKGSLQTFDLIKTPDPNNYYLDENDNDKLFYVKFLISLSNIETTVNGDKSKILTKNLDVLLDSGSSISYFPPSIVEGIAKQFKLKYNEDYEIYNISCEAQSGSVTFVFDETKIEVPLKDLVYLADGYDGCYFGISPYDVNYAVLGDNFFRHAYVVYDLDDKQIALAPASFSNDLDIEVISGAIPTGKATDADDEDSDSTESSTESSVSSVSTFTSESSSSDEDADNKEDNSALQNVPPLLYLLFFGFFLYSFA